MTSFTHSEQDKTNKTRTHMNTQEKLRAQQLNQEAIELYRSGMAPKEIAEKQSRKPSTIHSMLGKARQEGKLDVFKPRRKHNDNTYVLRRVIEKNNIGVGGIGPILKHNISSDVLHWIVDQVQKDGHNSIAEYLCELAIDAFFESQQSTGKF